jgi:hypothetical protein
VVADLIKLCDRFLARGSWMNVSREDQAARLAVFEREISYLRGNFAGNYNIPSKKAIVFMKYI